MATRRTSDSTRTPKPTAKSSAAAKPAEPKAAEAKKPAAPAAAKRVAKPKATKPVAPMQVSEDVRRGMIAEAAYLRAERRGFMNGNETEDWTAAEKEVDALLSASAGAGTQ